MSFKGTAGWLRAQPYIKLTNSVIRKNTKIGMKLAICRTKPPLQTQQQSRTSRNKQNTNPWARLDRLTSLYSHRSSRRRAPPTLVIQIHLWHSTREPAVTTLPRRHLLAPRNAIASGLSARIFSPNTYAAILLWADALPSRATRPLH